MNDQILLIKGLFSATMNEGLHRIIKAGLRNPVQVEVKVHTKDGNTIQEQKVPKSLKIEYLITPADQKLDRLVELLTTFSQKVIIHFGIDSFFSLLFISLLVHLLIIFSKYF